MLTSSSASEFVERKQSVAKLDNKGAKDAFDLDLANFLQTNMTEGDLVLCMASGKVLKRTDTVTAALVYWVSEGGTSKVACIDNHRRRVWLFHECPVELKRLKGASKREFDQWVATGGLHKGSQWHGPTRAHHIPKEITVVRLTDEKLEIYLHLYNRWVRLSQVCDLGMHSPKDQRVRTIFQQLDDLSGPWLSRRNSRENLLKYFGLPKPFDEGVFRDFDGHVHSMASDPAEQARNCHWL